MCENNCLFLFYFLSVVATGVPTVTSLTARGTRKNSGKSGNLLARRRPLPPRPHYSPQLSPRKLYPAGRRVELLTHVRFSSATFGCSRPSEKYPFVCVNEVAPRLTAFTRCAYVTRRADYATLFLSVLHTYVLRFKIPLT